MLEWELQPFGITGRVTVPSAAPGSVVPLEAIDIAVPALEKAEAAQWQQFRALKYEIEAMRRKPSLSGYVITELTDIYWESNGLMDMERNLRAFHEPFSHLNSDLVVLPGFRRWG